jgi:DNA invertase Pin-like site-specific DNA recombinase
MKTTCVIYSRVSSTNDRQDLKRQIADLTNYAERQNYRILNCYSERVSGAKKLDEREPFIEMLKYVKANQVNKILIWELSRLARNTSTILSVIEQMNTIGVSIYIHNYSLETLDAKGNTNPITALLTSVIGSFTQLERENITSRLQSGYKNARANGIKVGRKVNYTKPLETFRQENEEVIKLLRKGYSIRVVARLTSKSLGTVQKVKNSFLAQKSLAA